MGYFRKEIEFDLDDKKLEKYYLKASEGYADLREKFEKRNFELVNTTKSIFMSKEKLSDDEFKKILDEICGELPWIADCSLDVIGFDIGETKSYTGEELEKLAGKKRK